jgi:hypothetical protein
MTNEEFKAWFDGFVENISGTPTAKQWERVKKRVKEIDNTPVTRTVFNDYYVRPYRPYWDNPLYTASNIASHTLCKTEDVTPLEDFINLGKAEFKSTN